MVWVEKYLSLPLVSGPPGIKKELSTSLITLLSVSYFNVSLTCS